MLRRGPLRTTACGFHRTGLKQALPAWPSRSSSIPQGTALSRFTAEAVSNVSSGSDASRRRPWGSPDHVSTLSGPGTCPYPASCPGTAGGGPAMMSRFPAAFRPPAFASWSPCARWGTGPSLRSAYRSRCQGRTPTGLPRSARMSYGRGGCPLYPRDCGARTAGRSSPAAACRLAAAVPVPPSSNPPPEASYHEASSRVHGRSPVRPSPRLWPPGGAGALGLVPPSFTPRRYRRCMSGWGQASWALA